MCTVQARCRGYVEQPESRGAVIIKVCTSQMISTHWGMDRAEIRGAASTMVFTAQANAIHWYVEARGTISVFVKVLTKLQAKPRQQNFFRRARVLGSIKSAKGCCYGTT